MTTVKENAILKAAQLQVKCDLLEHISNFEMYYDFEDKQTFCESRYGYDSTTMTPDEFLNARRYENETYIKGHEKYCYQFELIEKIIKAINSL